MASRLKPPPKQRLLDAASTLFYAEGYDVSIDKIAEAASVAKPTVYAHFASKEALVEAVLEAASSDFLVQLDAEISQRDDPLERLSAAFDLLVADLPDPGYHGCLCVNAAAAFPAGRHRRTGSSANSRAASSPC
jgi:AcrR family transcriptional regulator